MRSVFSTKSLYYIGIPVFLFGVLIFLMTSTHFSKDELLTLGISLDLLLVVPLVYLFLIRKTEIPKSSVVPVMILGMLLGYLFMPDSGHTYLDLFKFWVLPIVELSIIALVFIRVRKGIQSFKELEGGSSDFFTVLLQVCKDMVPTKVVYPLATEISVMYYGFFNWKKRELNHNEFTNYKESSTIAIFGALIMMIMVESFALHLVLAKWSVVAAWVLTILSVYTAIQLFGFVRSVSKRPIVVGDNELLLRFGIMNEVSISYEDLKAVRLTDKDLEEDKLNRSLSPLGKLESHNVVLELKSRKQLIGVYGFRKDFTQLAIFVDEPLKFKAMLDQQSF